MGHQQWKVCGAAMQLGGYGDANMVQAVVRVQAWTNNQDTLTAEAVADLCGWDWDVICETEMPGLSPAEADKYMGSIPKTQTASFS